MGAYLNDVYIGREEERGILYIEFEREVELIKCEGSVPNKLET